MNARLSFGLVTAAAALTFGACSGGGEPAKPAATAETAATAAPANTTAAATTEAAAPSAAAASTTAAAPSGTAAAPAATTAAATTASTEIGVPECDDYFKKHMACIEGKVPESARAMLRQTLDQSKAQWKQLAATTPEARAALAKGCKQSTEAAKAAMAPYGCTW